MLHKSAGKPNPFFSEHYQTRKLRALYELHMFHYVCTRKDGLVWQIKVSHGFGNARDRHVWLWRPLNSYVKVKGTSLYNLYIVEKITDVSSQPEADSLQHSVRHYNLVKDET